VSWLALYLYLVGVALVVDFALAEGEGTFVAWVVGVTWPLLPVWFVVGKLSNREDTNA